MIAARLLTRLAILVASLAWGSAVFVHTVGDPDRAADIAAAVLADDEARAEVVTPVTAAVMRSTGLPVEQQPVVAAEVDRILRDPAGAATFIEPFVGSWAATLGIDDPRSSQLDVSRLVALSPALAALQPPSEGGGAVLPSISDLPLPAVGAAEGIPFFDGGFGWVGGLDRVAGAAVVPLTILAVVLAGVALVIGDRRPILRRLGAWAIGAGAFWLVFPAVAVWLARRWATGADAVVDVAVGEATSGLVFPALVLVLAGAGALTVSFAVAPAGSGPDAGSTARSMPRSVEPTPGRPPLHPRDEDRRYSGALAARAAEGSSTQRMETTRPEPLDRTAVMPGVVSRTESPPPERWPAPGEPSSRPTERAP
ncbi:MAG: hypothetical protein RLZZ01_1295, partial [Actinomycetota bacterium]